MTSLIVTALRCENRVNPLGLDTDRPRFSWILESERRGAQQTAYQVRVARTPEALNGGGADLWDSGKVASDQSVLVEYEGTYLKSGDRACWTVTVWDENDEATDASETAFWEMGLRERSEWKGEWIGADMVGGPNSTSPSPYLRRAFTLDKPITSARLYATALGLYECSLNGERVGTDRLAPGWTDYKTRIQYQVYEVTGQLQQGANVWGAILGDGWYCGHIGWRERQAYGDRPKFLGQLVVTYADGTTETITTGTDWEWRFGPILENDLLMGESYDARLEMPNWDAPSRDPHGNWYPVLTFPDPGAELVAMRGPTVRDTEELTPIGAPARHGGSWIVDVGINMVGRVRLKVKGEAGQTVRLRYAEVREGGPANPTGGIYTPNLRSAKQTDYYTLKGDPEGEVWESRFTFHGFRYIEVTGYPGGEPPQDAITGIVMHSDIPVTGTFACSDPLVNQLFKNIDWGQRGNYVDIPTDCPQRDERLGWTGDAQVFVRTAAFNRDIHGFFQKWLLDLRDAQSEEGAYPSVAPHFGGMKGDGGPAWADAGIICPWTVYLCYGDKKTLEDAYPSMQKYIAYLENTAIDLIRCHEDYRGFKGYGDWLAQDGSGKTEGGTPKDLIGTAFFAYSAGLLSKIAHVLGKSEDTTKYQSISEKVAAEFRQRYVTPEGLVIPGTQTAYILALHFDLLQADQRPTAIKQLVRDIQQRGDKLTAGFVGAVYLPHVLTNIGRPDVAYKLLFQKQWPSWLYAVTQGATTIWERWDGWTHDKGFQDVGMNSFNHYAYGAIGSWLYERVAGIDLDPEKPGYKHILLHPLPGEGMSSAKASLDSVYGCISSHWTHHGGTLNWDVTVPPNTTATARIPAAEGAKITEGGNPAESAEGVTFVKYEDGAAVYTLVSGTYHFEVSAG